jgi:type II restriction/modification system DNA methylase subunit YeeA
MDTNALKKFAQSARNLAIDQVTAKLALVLDPSSPVRREHAQAIKKLDAAIAQNGKQQVIEQVAYTWFNRFTALRFMDAQGYTNPRVVSPAEGATRPEILSEALAGNLPDGAPDAITALLSGRIPSNDPQAEAYRLLLVHACNQWHGPMPFLFEQIDDFTELLMPEDLLSQTSILADLRKVMTEDACKDVEIIGWLYQFYISEKKDQVFAGLKKNQKITAENIPAATQLFTPHWIVRYLVENSLGRLWLLNRPQSRLAERMDYYIAPEEPETDFLRISRPEDISICDPAAGSGHMLTYAFDLLYAIYEEEGYEADKIPALILTHNLTGVEIDDRAGALAGFALAMKAAAKLGRRRFLRMAVQPDICVLSDVSFTPAEMQDVAAVVGRDLFTDDLRETLGQFEQAKNFGSLIVPKLRDPAEALRVVEARDFGGDLLLKEVQARVVAVLRMAAALSSKYHVVVANPPYMGSRGMNAEMTVWSKKAYPDSRADLFSMFMERSLALTAKRGFMAMVNMQAWMFLSTFEKLREKLLKNAAIVSMAHLGTRAFDTIGGEVVSTTAFVFENGGKPAATGTYLRLVDGENEGAKSETARQAARGNRPHSVFRVPSVHFAKIPGSPIAYWVHSEFANFFESESIGEITDFSGSQNITASNETFVRNWHEVASSKVMNKWRPYAKGGEFRKHYGNLWWVVDWSPEARAHYKNTPTGNLLSEKLWYRKGITYTDITTRGFASRYLPEGCIYDKAGPAFHPDETLIDPLLAYLNTSAVNYALSVLNPTIHCQVRDVKALPVPPLSSELSVSGNRLRTLSQSDWDAYETSWDFTSLPLLQSDYRAETLEATYSTVRTHWQGMTDEMQRLEEENNRIFIDAYGLQDELTPEVPLNEITLTCNPGYRYGIKNDAAANETRLRADTMAEFLSYAVGCMFGRYSLDAPGLILANQGEMLADYLARVPDPSFTPDEDNVIPVLDADWFADDITDRFRQFLRVSFGEDAFRENLRFIEDALGKDIRKYFTKDFYADHVKRYKKRPIYWQFASPKGSFQALIYMHRYRPDTVSVLLNEYLRAYLSKLEAERARLDQLADDASASQAQRTKALKDASAIAKQLDELNEWEREVVFPLAQQKIEIDLDAGVKANYPLLGAALKKILGLEATDE